MCKHIDMHMHVCPLFYDARLKKNHGEYFTWILWLQSGVFSMDLEGSVTEELKRITVKCDCAICVFQPIQYMCACVGCSSVAG